MMVPNVLLNNRKTILTILLICFPFSIGFVFVQNKYTHSRPMHLSTNRDTHTLQTDSNAAFLFTLPLSFPLDIFARCHLWNTVETQRDVSWACLALQAVGRLIKGGGTAWSPPPFFTDWCCCLEALGRAQRATPAHFFRHSSALILLLVSWQGLQSCY